MFSMIRKWESSGLSQEKFIGQHGIPKSTFGYWRKKYLKETSHKTKKDKFIPVKVSDTAKSIENNSGAIEVVYPNGVRLVCSEGMDLSRLKPLIVL